MSFTIGIVAEGPTDVAVISNVIAGIPNSQDNVFTYLRPETLSGPFEPTKLSNWSQVLAYCESDAFRHLVLSEDYVDLVVIHIDTDQFDPVHSNIPTHEDGREITSQRKYELARQIIIRRIGADTFDMARARIVSAICVDSIECWLLPLYFASSRSKRSKTTGCFAALQSHEAARNIRKDYARYQKLPAPYAKQEVLITHAEHNFSLGEFLANAHIALQQWIEDEPAH